VGVDKKRRKSLGKRDPKLFPLKGEERVKRGVSHKGEGGGSEEEGGSG